MNSSRQKPYSRGFKIAIAGSVGLIGIETGLRFDEAVVARGASMLEAVLQAGVLAIVTLVLLWASYHLLVRAEPILLYRRRGEVEDLEARAAAATAYANGAANHLGHQRDALTHVSLGRTEALSELEKAVQAELPSPPSEELHQ